MTTRCDTTSGRVGSFVLAPSGANHDEVSVRVVAGIGKTADACVRDGYHRLLAEPASTGCIVSRRSLDYIPHTPLLLPIEQQQDCIDVPCAETTTCLRGVCVPAKVQCKSGRCEIGAAGGDAGTGGSGGQSQDASLDGTAGAGGASGGTDGSREDGNAGCSPGVWGATQWNQACWQ